MVTGGLKKVIGCSDLPICFSLQSTTFDGNQNIKERQGVGIICVSEPDIFISSFEFRKKFLQPL